MKLWQVARFIKSNNAGATYLTFDIGFPDEESFDRAVDNGVFSQRAFAAIYKVPVEEVQIFPLRTTRLVKVTIPRPCASGGIDERDFDGVQQFAPLLDFEVPS